ncbi:dynamin family protein [Pontibacillus sp. HMF3514]|uniref:dynamin family protein n=1 Tax=Pontibacillus sp. HMF3514 TaxID=2692425 RepID=UPI0013201CB5|nr:dynamin family protein [Pontibacillus sp. HMF3514]QHE52412.1 hypothetical protein GS400_10345 [Pontibacillus sp. HMF3514]
MSIETSQKQNTINKLSTLYNRLIELEDKQQAQKTLDLLEKLQSEEFLVGFAGHFSAGKSTMINTVLEEEILPSSPIPTSANLVKVKKGRGYVRVYFAEEDPVEYEEPYDLDAIKSYCKEGDAIRAIELSKSDSLLPSGVSVMDTPGIDSSNDADKIMTESALHLVDVLFYVMDYNHVQSEVNLAFLSEMQKRGKPLYIVINQIDKHQEEELSFSAFQQSVSEAFSRWGIQPKDTFYTSLTKMSHPSNQFQQLKETLNHLFTNKDRFIDDTIEHSTVQIVNEHLDSFNEEQKERIEELTQSINDSEPRPVEDVESEINNLKERPKQAEKALTERLQSSLKNAYIMPHEVREKARLVIEAYQSDFKVGLFFTKSKTEEERQNRLIDFHHALMEKVSANIEWPVRNVLVTLAKEYGIQDEEILQQLQDFSVQYEASELADLIKTGAGSGGDYLLVYTEDVANDIRRKYKQEAQKKWKTVSEVLEEQSKEALQEKEKMKEQSEQVEDVQIQIANVQKAIEERTNSLQDILNEKSVSNDSYEKATAALLQRESSVKPGKSMNLNFNQQEQREEEVEIESTIEDKSHVNVDEMIDRIDKSQQELESLTGFQSILEDLRERKKRLETRHFTVALFGAFSAGKSSFANALLGEKVLPVSPNPTTATINKISPPTPKHEHGTVVVKLKSSEQLYEDLIHALHELPFQPKAFNDVLEWIQQSPNEIQKYAKDQKRLSFLQAIVDGFDEMASSIGETIEIDLDRFAEYVAEERLSCYVEWMELYYDCAFTREGITLVDTPGADSVNARHTEVSFEYIKQADAILFVTYYNHPFSRADRDFLIQLGRVKDAFSLDKMFFIVNAADLAQSKSELELVQDYLAEQLGKFGIRFPRMFAISSLMAANEKMKEEKTDHPVLGSSGIDKFEESFYSFIHEELTSIITNAAIYDLERANRTLGQYIDSASLNKQEKQQKLKKYQKEEEELKSMIHAFSTARYSQDINQKIEKQMYYMNERVLLRFSDFFKEAFNPSTINGTGGVAKEQLKQALQDLLDQLREELLNECRAVTVRIEAYLHEKLQEFNEDIQDKGKNVQEDLSLPNAQEIDIDTPGFNKPFEKVKQSEIEKPLSSFKNTKSFFEKNEKEQMKEDLQYRFKPIIQSYIDEQKHHLQEYYQPQWNSYVEREKEVLSKALKEYYEGLRFALGDQLNIEELKAKREKLQKLTPQE